MKDEAIPRIGVIDALTAGLNLAGRAPWLLTIPAGIDLLLWLGPRLSIGVLLERLLTGWEKLVRAFYSPSQMAALEEMLSQAHEAVKTVGPTINLADVVTGSWLAPSSAVVGLQTTRLKLISDGVLAPMGFALPLPGMSAPAQGVFHLEIPSVLAALAIIVVLWLIGQVLTTVYLSLAAGTLNATLRGASRARTNPGERPPASPAPARPQPGLARLVARFLGLSILLGVAVFLLRIPMGLALGLTMLTGSSFAGFVLVLSGGFTLWLTLWFLTSFFFVSEAILLDGMPLWPSFLQSLGLVRRASMRTLVFVVLVNVLTLGFRAVWGLIGQSTVGVLLAILGNAYLTTGMLMAVFVYYAGLRREVAARVRTVSTK